MAIDSYPPIVRNFIDYYINRPFGGRNNALEALDQWISGHGDSRTLLISAPAGSGKTSLLVAWLRRISDDCHIVFVPISIRFETNSSATFHRLLATQLAGVINEELEMPLADPEAFYREKSLEFLEKIAVGEKKCLVVVDGLDEARNWTLTPGFLRQGARGNLWIIVSARETLSCDAKKWMQKLDWSERKSSSTHLLTVPSLDEEGIADVFRKLGRPIDSFAQRDDILAELRRLTEGKPLIVGFFASDLMEMGDNALNLTFEDLKTRKKTGFAGYFEAWLEEQRAVWLDGTDNQKLFWLLGILAIALGPLRKKDIDELFKRLINEDKFVLTDFLMKLDRFLISEGPETAITFCHDEIGEHVKTHLSVDLLRKITEVYVAGES